jgi:hypothetical protein
LPRLRQCLFCIDSHAELTRIAGHGEIDPDSPASARPQLRAVRAFLDLPTMGKPPTSPERCAEMLNINPRIRWTAAPEVATRNPRRTPHRHRTFSSPHRELLEAARPFARLDRRAYDTELRQQIAAATAYASTLAPTVTQWSIGLQATAWLPTSPATCGIRRCRTG